MFLVPFSLAFNGVSLNKEIVFNGEFAPGNTLYTSWIKTSSISEERTSLYVRGTYIWPDRDNLPLTCTMVTHNKRVCEEQLVYYDRAISVCPITQYFEGAGLFSRLYEVNDLLYFFDHSKCKIKTITMSKLVPNVCHYEEVTEEVCKVDTRVRCSRSNVMYPTNIEYTLNGNEWKQLAYRWNIIGSVVNGKAVKIKFRVNIPEPCYGLYHPEQGILFRGIER